jgi:hypothetical protein
MDNVLSSIVIVGLVIGGMIIFGAPGWADFGIGCIIYLTSLHAGA